MVEVLGLCRLYRFAEDLRGRRSCIRSGRRLMRKRRKRRVGSWQTLRLKEFAARERGESDIYEKYFRVTKTDIPFRILSVMVFFQKETYLRKTGSLVALYRVSEGTATPIIDFVARYDAYYSVLEKEGYL